jgi:hypothetical protein
MMVCLHYRRSSICTTSIACETRLGLAIAEVLPEKKLCARGRFSAPSSRRVWYPLRVPNESKVRPTGPAGSGGNGSCPWFTGPMPDFERCFSHLISARSGAGRHQKNERRMSRMFETFRHPTPRRDSNPHVFRQQIENLPRLPIPPRGQAQYAPHRKLSQCCLGLGAVEFRPAECNIVTLRIGRRAYSRRPSTIIGSGVTALSLANTTSIIDSKSPILAILRVAAPTAAANPACCVKQTVSTNVNSLCSIHSRISLYAPFGKSHGYSWPLVTALKARALPFFIASGARTYSNRSWARSLRQ